MDVDAHSVLHIKKAKYKDSNVYSCWYQSKEQYKFNLKGNNDKSHDAYTRKP